MRLGIDVGSTTVKLVLLDDADQIVYKKYERHMSGVFEKVGEIEKHHAERYQTLLDNINNDKVYHKDEEVIWICRNCGHVYYGKDALKVCPVCNHPESYMELKATNWE